jgi:hypothetical protein
MGARKDQALLEPALNVAKVTGDIKVEELVKLLKPNAVWKAYFTSERNNFERQNRSSSISEKSWEEVDSISLEKLNSVNSTLRPQRN